MALFEPAIQENNIVSYYGDAYYPDSNYKSNPVQKLRIVGSMIFPVRQEKAITGTTKISSNPMQVKVHIFDKDFNRIRTVLSDENGLYTIKETYKNQHIVFESLGLECPSVTQLLPPNSESIYPPPQGTYPFKS